MSIRPSCFQSHYCMLSLDPIPIAMESRAGDAVFFQMAPHPEKCSDVTIVLTGLFSRDFVINNPVQYGFGNGIWSEWHD